MVKIMGRSCVLMVSPRATGAGEERLTGRRYSRPVPLIPRTLACLPRAAAGHRVDGRSAARVVAVPTASLG